MLRRAGQLSAFLVILLAAGWALGAEGAQTAAQTAADSARPVWKTVFLGFGFGLLFLALAWLPTVFSLAGRTLAGQPKAWLGGLGATVLAGAVLRLFIVPHNVVTQYMGYVLTRRAAELGEIARYGVGGQVLWRSLFQIAPADHAAVIYLHAVLGTLTLVLLAAVLLRAGMRPVAALAATAIAAFLPQLLWADASDSLTVPVLFFTVGATLYAQEYLAQTHAGQKGWSALAGAVFWLSFAAQIRPEHVIFGPLLLLVFVAAGGEEARLRDRLRAPLVGWLVGAGAYVALVIPQILYAFHMRGIMQARGGWPHTFTEILPDIPMLFFTRNGLLDPAITPLALGPLALLGLVSARRWADRRLRLWLLGLGVVWMCFYYVDLSVASAPRLHVVLALPAAIVAGGLLGDLWRLRPERTRWLGPALGAVALGALVAGVPTAARALFQPTNEAEEDRLFREAVAALPTDSPFLFVRMGRGDRAPEDDTHLHHPDYLVRPPARQGYVLSMTELMARNAPPKQPVYYYKGLRCYSQLRREDAPAPPSYFARACRQMEETYALEPIVERTVPNHGDRMLPYYPAQESFQVGLYRVVGLRDDGSGLAAARSAARVALGGQQDLTQPADEPELPKVKVVPPGQEALVTTLLGGDETTAGCKLDGAGIEMTLVRGRYACAGGKATVELRSLDAPGADGAGVVRTEQFALVPGGGAPAELVQALAERVRAHEAEWHWAEANAPSAVAAIPPVERHEPPKDVGPEFRRKYEQVHELYRQSKHAEALPICLELARERPEWGGVLGLLVANLAPTQPDAERVARYKAEADANPDDVLAQFVAGVAAHYSAHYTAKTREEKKELYRTCIHYLERARPAFDYEPRVFIYLAVSHFRLGHQEEAERFIEKALTLDRKDPDGFYCRAEIFQRKDPPRSLADLQKYIDMTTGAGHITQGDKSKRVQEMKEKLEARVRGEGGDEELWDPLAGE